MVTHNVDVINAIELHLKIMVNFVIYIYFENLKTVACYSAIQITLLTQVFVLYTHTHVCMYIYRHIYVCICTHICMYVYI